MPATMADNTDNEQMLLEGVVYYVDPKSVGTLAFLGGKERIRIPITSTHSSLEALRRHIIEYAGLKAESEKRGLGSCIELKLCRLAKGRRGQQSLCYKHTGTVGRREASFFKVTVDNSITR